MSIVDDRALAERLRAEEAFDTRMVAAYRAALSAQHHAIGGTVYIAVGADVIETLKGRTTKHTGESAERLWGFPMLPADEHLPTDHISVHTVITIA